MLRVDQPALLQYRLCAPSYCPCLQTLTPNHSIPGKFPHSQERPRADEGRGRRRMTT